MCLERIKRRGREGEDNITLSYLEFLDQEYEKHISEFARNHKESNVKIIDYDEEFPEESLINFVKQG